MAGNDTLYGGKGLDTMTGGTGMDTFVIEDIDAINIITDYNFLEGNDIDLVPKTGLSAAPSSAPRTPVKMPLAQRGELLKAIEYLKQGEPARAKKILQKVLSDDPCVKPQ